MINARTDMLSGQVTRGIRASAARAMPKIRNRAASVSWCASSTNVNAPSESVGSFGWRPGDTSVGDDQVLTLARPL